MARPWDSTLYVESHYPAFSPPPKCLEYFDLGVLVAHRKAVLSFAAVVVPPPAAAPASVVPSTAIVVVPSAVADLVVAPAPALVAVV